VIRVRYKDLSPGLHGQAEWSARGTTVYLLPGRTGGQRRAALRRLRQEASRGCGPALPGPDLTMALAADRFRVGLRNTAAVIRLHPAGSLLPTALAGLLMAFFVLASVSARMAQLPQTPPGASLSAVGNPTVVGAPALAQESGAGGPASGSGAHGTSHAGGQGQAPWSLVASSTQPKPSHQSRHQGRVTVIRAGAPHRWHLSAKTGDADWGDSQTGNADWGDAPAAS